MWLKLPALPRMTPQFFFARKIFAGPPTTSPLRVCKAQIIARVWCAGIVKSCGTFVDRGTHLVRFFFDCTLLNGVSVARRKPKGERGGRLVLVCNFRIE